MSEIVEDYNDGKISSAYVRDFFGVGKTKLEEHGYRLISLEENAALRMLEGYESDITRKGNIVREGLVFIPSVLGGFLTKTPSFIEHPLELKKYITTRGSNLTDEELDKSLVDSVKFSSESIPTDRFGEDPLTNFIFGKFSGDYGKFLKERGIRELILPSQGRLSSKRKPSIRYLFFGGVDYYTGIDKWRGGNNNVEGGERSSLIGRNDLPLTASPKLSARLRGIKGLK